jgi:hypothetical protein
MNGELEIMLKEAVMAEIEEDLLSWNLSGGIEDKHEKYHWDCRSPGRNSNSDPHSY